MFLANAQAQTGLRPQLNTFTYEWYFTTILLVNFWYLVLFHWIHGTVWDFVNNKDSETEGDLETKLVVRLKSIFKLPKDKLNYCLYTWSLCQSTGMTEYWNTGGQCLLGITQGFEQVWTRTICFCNWRSNATDICKAVSVSNVVEISRIKVFICN